MSRDPFHQKIVEALDRRLDGTIFEACANELLRPEWPNLIPIPGGDDAGVDGAFVDNGERGILVATTQKDVIGNVTGNLKEHIAKGRTARKVLVATSRQLSVAKCRNIEKRIGELGFILAHSPYTQEAIANRLYHNSRWLKELLGLTGGVSALSSIPVGNRPLRDLPLIGRDKELKWLRETLNDRLLVGQPGIGKTFLSQAYVNCGGAFFATSDDIERLSDAIRDQQPTAIIIEDAHRKLPLLSQLVRYRTEVGGEFTIIADCWPGAANEVANALMLPKSNRHELQPLSADLIVELVKAAGIHGPDYLLQQIVRQSLGCPGRAALLAFAVRTNRNVQDIYNGRAFADWAYPIFKELTGPRSLPVLAAFALGGDIGMRTEVVAKSLGYPLGDVTQLLADLSLGGVVHESRRGTVCILPESFRSALVADHFFGGPAKLPYEWALAESDSRASVIDGLIRARARGAEISLSYLFHLVGQMNDAQCWETFLWHDATAASSACDRHPELLRRFPKPCLEQVPNLVIPRLLEQAIGDDRNLNSNTDHPLRLLQDWVHAAGPSAPRSIDRRRTLWHALRPLLARNSEHCAVALKALAVALTPQWEHHVMKPGDGRTVNIRRGCIDDESLRCVAELWDDALHALPKDGEFDWPIILGAIHEWCFPGAFGGRLTETQIALFRQTAEMLLKRLAQLAEGKPAILTDLEWRASHLQVALPVEIAPEFRVLFPGDKRRPADGDWTAHEQAKTQAANELATEWSMRPPQEVMLQWAWFINEAKRCARVSLYLSETVAWHIATHVADVRSWLQSVLEAQMPGEILFPLLQQAAAQKTQGWQNALQNCLRNPIYKSAAISIGIRVDEPLDAAMEVTLLEAANELPHTVERGCWDGNVPQFRLVRFLEFPKSPLAGTVASAMWYAHSHGHPIPSDLRDTWRQAVIHSTLEDYARGEIFHADTEAAFGWLLEFARRTDRLFDHQESVSAAIAVLTQEQRAAVLQHCNTDWYSGAEIVAAVVGDDTVVYRALLQDESKRALHLSALRGEPNESWATLAIVALDCGHAAIDVARIAFSETEAFCGHLYEQYIEQAQKWDVLRNHPNERIREVARLGEEQCLKNESHWRAHEEREDFLDIYG